MNEGIHKNQKHRSAMIILVILTLVLIASFVGNFCVDRIRSKVRSTTIQVISELTSNKALILTSLLEESAQDVRILASSLGAVQDNASVHSLLEDFQESHKLEALAVLDHQGRSVYGDGNALAMKGIPPEFAALVAADGFAVSDTVLGLDGNQVLIIGAAVSGGNFVYAALSTNSLQTACGETTYLGEGYSYVLERDGDIIIPPIRYSYEQVYENIRVLLTDCGNETKPVEQFMDALAVGQAGSVIFTIYGTEQLLCFEPLEMEKKWQFVTVVPLAAVEKDGAKIIETAVYMASIIIGAIAAALAAGLFFYLSMQKKQQQNDRFLLNIYQAISENTDSVIFILNSRTMKPDYVFENSGRVLGIPAKEFLDDDKPEKDGGTLRKELQALLQEPWPSDGCRREIHTYNDRLHRDMWLKILVCPFRLDDELKCIYAVTDVTQEHHDREKISAAVVAAEQANAAKSSFFSNMSHDMRTPMNGIVGMTAIAKRSLKDPDRLLDCLNKIDFSSKHLLSLINDVLDMSKIESGKLALSSEPFDLFELLQGLETILRPQCDAKEQTLSVSIEISHSGLIGDPLRLNQILMNLLSNAVKFTPSGGSVNLTVREQEQNTPSHSTYRFTVKDNGIGISPEFQKIIFSPFERASDTAVQQIEGTGLGMAITKNLISAMGGQISLQSELGKGTSFIVDLELPLQEIDVVEPSHKESVPLDENSFAGRRFLLAEDNEINQEIAVELLSGYGAAVDVAGNGKRALELFLASKTGYYDAILMDIQMPVMNGYDAAKAIRACGHPQAAAIPIVAMTANVFVEDVLAAKHAGMDAHIPKPIDMEYLYQVLQDRMAAVR